jgi:hypothetical protein
MPAKQHSFQKYLPDHWNDWIREKALTDSDGEWEVFNLYHHFGSDLTVWFEDGSVIKFKHAFAGESEEHDELAVFTEHNGYHVFPASSVVKINTKII